MKELENACEAINKDEDLLDRAERRDLPTPHQELIWRGKEGLTGESSTSLDTSEEIGFSELDAMLNWNTSSSFENLDHMLTTSTPKRTRTPAPRRSGVYDPIADDMINRMKASANRIPTTTASTFDLSNQSYLILSPLERRDDTFMNPFNKPEAPEKSSDPDEPDITIDDMVFRNNRDINSGAVKDPQPKFGVPVRPVAGGADSDYLHAVPKDRYRSHFNAMRNPDTVKDDLAFRMLRKDSNHSDPDLLGIVRNSSILLPRRAWENGGKFSSRSSSSSSLVFQPHNKHSKASRSLSEGITEIIRKQSSRPSADFNHLVSYCDVEDIVQWNKIKGQDAQKQQGSNKYKTKTLERRRKKKQGNNAKDRTVFGVLYKVKDNDSEDYSSDNSNNNNNTKDDSTELTSDHTNVNSDSISHDDMIINNNNDNNDPNTNFDIKPSESINEDESIDSLAGITEQLSLESTASINTTDTSNTSLLTVLEIQGAISEQSSPRDNENQNEDETDPILYKTSDVINVDKSSEDLEKITEEENDAFDNENKEDETPCDDLEINVDHHQTNKSEELQDSHHNQDQQGLETMVRYLD